MLGMWSESCASESKRKDFFNSFTPNRVMFSAFLPLDLL